jgi:hypothetical protein
MSPLWWFWSSKMATKKEKKITLITAYIPICMYANYVSIFYINRNESKWSCKSSQTKKNCRIKNLLLSNNFFNMSFTSQHYKKKEICLGTYVDECFHIDCIIKLHFRSCLVRSKVEGNEADHLKVSIPVMNEVMSAYERVRSQQWTSSNLRASEVSESWAKGLWAQDEDCEAGLPHGMVFIPRIQIWVFLEGLRV